MLKILTCICICLILPNLVLAQYKLEKLGAGINTTEYDEICPVVSRDHKTLYFTRVASPDFNRTLINDTEDFAQTQDETTYFSSLRNIFDQIAQKRISDPVHSTLNQDIWIAESSNGLFDVIHHPLYPINNALPNSVCSLSPDENTLVITNHFYRDGSLYKGFSFIKKEAEQEFGFPEPLFIKNYYSHSAEVNLSMSKDGDVLILSLIRENGHGDMDLYVCFRIKDNLWSEPLNLGPTINSKYRDLTPHLSEDKSRLFFASNRPGGLGGTDIYASRRLDYSWKKWTEPELLKAPINSTFDDSNPILVEPNAYVYFTSRREGSSDIYRVSLHNEEEIKEPITIRGVFKNSITHEIIDGNLLYGYTDLPLNILPSYPVVNEFILQFKKKETYRLAPRKSGYIGKNQLIDVSILESQPYRDYYIEFFLAPLYEEEKLDLKNIYFERGTAVVRQDSYSELDRLAVIMHQNTSTQIRIEGHTDSVGVEHELLDLSRQRAESIKTYLVMHKNIGSNRINTFGFGGLRPISPNNTEENRAKNRRVEIYLTHANLTKRIDHKSLPEPIITPIDKKSDFNTNRAKEGISKHGNSKITTSKATTTTIPVDQNVQENTTPLLAIEKKIQEFAKIQFVENELAIKQTSFEAIRKLIEYAKSKPNATILLSGFTSPQESILNPENFALSRAKGVKEYLVFKSIETVRVQIVQPSEKQNFSGVLIQIEE